MTVFTTRSGQTLHFSRSCPDLRGKPVFSIAEEDALPRAQRCTEGRCQVAFLRDQRRVAA